MKPDFSIKEEHVGDGFISVIINTSKAKYQGISWKSLGDFGKRKFENLLVLSRPSERLKIFYL